MSARTCPWCGGPNLRITNCMGTHPLCKDGAIYWEDRDCGYREETTHNERYDYKTHRFIQQEYKVLRWHKPRAPLPAHQLPEYLRSGKVVEIKEIPAGQQTLAGSAPA